MSSWANFRAVRRHGFALLLWWAIAGFACSQAAQAGTLPSGFQESSAFTGLTKPATISFAPNGRVFVGEMSGVIKTYSSLADSTPTVVADLRTETHNFWDRGMLGLAVDPQFPARPYIYALYSHDAMPGGTAPRWGSPGATGDPCPSPPGPTGDGCVITGRLARLTISGETMSAKTNLLTDWCQQYPSHSVGDLKFGPDGALYVTGGDGASFGFTDWGQDGNPLNPCGDPPAGVGGAMSPPTAQGGALRSQDARTTADPTGLNGALLRIDPDTGAGLPGNPFFASSDLNLQRIAAIGFRNPFRFTVRPGTEEVWVGDVGWGAWEEINRVIDPSDAGADNLGWPCYEGPERQGGYDGANLDLCENLYTPGDTGVVPPYYSYSHSAQVVPGENCDPGSSSITGLSFYESGAFPNSYDGALFFADFSRGCIWSMLPGTNGLPDPSTIQTFVGGALGPVDLEVHQGDLYYANLDGTIQRVRYEAGNQSPTAVATATPSNGAAPLTVQLSASGSSDPDDAFNTLSFAWDADADGQFDDGNAATLSRTYPAGSHVASVRVTDPDGASDTDSVTIQANNTPPVARIDAPTTATTWAVDDLVAFAGSATDAQETLPATAFDWELVINHCPSNCHAHVAEQFPDRVSGSFSAPDHEYPSTLTVRLTVTDAGGLTDTESVTIDPRTVSLTLDSTPDGLQLGLNSAQAAPAPFTRTVIEGSQNTVIASSPQTLGGDSYAFSSWSDGGAAAHNVTVDQNTTLTATFTDTTAPAPPQITDTDPDPPSSDNDPEVKGTTGAGSPTAVKLYTNASCTGSPAATGTPTQFAGAGITVAVPANATTQLAARTSDASGNDSTCSVAFPYVEDSTPPAAPSITDTDPDSPSSDNDPEVKGTTGAGSPTAVKLYTNASCSGSPAATGTPAQFAGAGITAAVPANATTQLAARTSDASGNDSSCSTAFSYTEDSTPPAAPAITDTDPDSPSSDNNPEVKGTTGAGSPTVVEIYANSSCSGSPAATGTPAQFVAGITVSVPANAVTQLSAVATDAAGNDSACSSSFSYTEDSTPPAAPAITDTDPDSPSGDNNPEVKGTTVGSPISVEIYTNASCSGAPAASGTPTQFAGAGLTVAVPANAITQLSALATDAAGNDSSCSAASSYTEDSTPPAAPAITDTDPDSPSSDNNPEVKGTTGAGSPTVVEIYANSSCSGSPAASGTPAQFVGGITVTVPANTTTQLSALATDAAGNDSTCSGSFSYTEDSTPPATPAITDTDPDSPSSDNDPEVKGTTGAGSPVSVDLYANGSCSGSPAATGTPGQFVAGITVSVPANAVTQLSAVATDTAGNDSNCSGSFSYTEDSTPPAAPATTDTDPDSPSSDNDPEVNGTTGVGSPVSVELYTNGSCSGSPAATGTPAQFAGAGITVAVPADAVTQLAARTSDASGNDSTCSNSFSYTEDSTPPAAPAITDTDPDSPSSDNDPEVKGTTGAGSPTSVELYSNGSCSGSPSASGTPAEFVTGITVSVPANATTQLSVLATDAADNASNCSGSFSYTEDSDPPAAPQITDTDPDSPSGDSNPEVKGTTGAGSPTAVVLYTDASCSGSPAATGAPTQFADGGITVAVPADATTQLAARTADAAGNESGCSETIEYIEDSTAPLAPEITGTDPGSPANDNDPAVRGTTGPESTVRLFESDDCSGPVAAQGSAAQFAGPGLTASVPDDSTTNFTAVALDGVNESACSGSFSYSEDSTAPETLILSGPPPKVKMPAARRANRVKRSTGAAVIFNFVADEPVDAFRCSLDGAGPTPCVSPLNLTGLKLGPHTFEVRATDATGNLDATPAVNSFKVVKKKRKKRQSIGPDAVARRGY